MIRNHLKRHEQRFPFIQEYRTLRHGSPILPHMPANEKWHRGLFVERGIDHAEDPLVDEDNWWLINIAQTVNAPLQFAGPIPHSIPILTPPAPRNPTTASSVPAPHTVHAAGPSNSSNAASRSNHPDSMQEYEDDEYKGYNKDDYMDYDQDYDDIYEDDFDKRTC